MNNCRYGKRFQVRVWLKRNEFIPRAVDEKKRMQEEQKLAAGAAPKKSSRRNGGKGIHLGGFGSVNTATSAFDIAEIFFKGDKGQPNNPMATYTNR